MRLGSEYGSGRGGRRGVEGFYVPRVFEVNMVEHQSIRRHGSRIFSVNYRIWRVAEGFGAVNL